MQTKLLGGSRSRGHRPLRAELKRMVIIKDLFMEVVSIVIQHPLNPLYLVIKDQFQFQPLNFTQKFLNVSEKILWPRKLLVCHCRLHVSEKREVRMSQVRTVTRTGHSNNRIVNENVYRDFWAVEATVVKVQT
jgi:hypothetical protein